MCKCEFECNKWHKVESKDSNSHIQTMKCLKYRKYRTRKSWAVEITRGYGNEIPPKCWSQEQIIYRNSEKLIDKQIRSQKYSYGVK